MLEAHEVIGMDECPPSTFEFNPRAQVLVDLTREPLGAEEAFPVLDAAYEAGVESDAVFVAWLHRVDVPKCEARGLVASWRAVHPDPWIWAHSYAFDGTAEMACLEGA